MSAPLNPGGAGACCAPQCSNSPQYQIPGPAGVSAFTYTQTLFTMPAVGGTVLVNVQNSIWMAAGAFVAVEGAGVFEVSSIPDGTHVLLINTGYTGNLAPLSNVPAFSKVVPSGQGGTLANAFSTTTGNFTMPAVSANVSIPIVTSAFLVAGAYFFVASAGAFLVASVTDSTHVVGTNLGYPGNAAPTTVINSGQGVVPTGQRGPSGATGSSTLNAISPTTTKGDLIVDNGASSPLANDIRVGVGSDGKVLVADSAQPAGVGYTTITPNSATTDGNIPVFNGTTGTPMALKDSKMLITSDGALQSTPSGGNARGSKAVDLQVDRSIGIQVASGSNSAITGGKNNAAIGASSVVGGGEGNATTGASSGVCAGASNTASGTQSFIGGGSGNTASNTAASVAAGLDNTASAANSFVGGGNLNTASGTDSTVAAGLGNTSSGFGSTIGGGKLNVASGDYATVPGGQSAKAQLTGQVAHASGQFAAAGDAQTSELIWRKATTDATANVELFLDGNTLRAIVPLNTTWGFDILVTARSSAGVGACWRITGAIQNNANTVALVAAVTDAVLADGTGSTWGVAGSVAVSADNVNKSLQVAVTGAAATSIRWVARARLVEVGY